MPANVETIRRCLLELPGVEEGSCHGTPAWYVRRKLVSRLWEDGETLVVKILLAERDALLSRAPDTYFLTDHYRKYSNVLVNLLAISEEDLRAALIGAWRCVAAARAVTAFDTARKKTAEP